MDIQMKKIAEGYLIPSDEDAEVMQYQTPTAWA
jgi:hypothetical protein